MKKVIISMLAGFVLFGCSNNSPKVADQAATETLESPAVIFNDMENALGGIPSWINEKTISRMPEGASAHSGIFVTRVDGEDLYSYTFRENFSNINEKLPVAVIVEGYVFSAEKNPSLSIIVDINENNKTVLWKSYALNDVITNLNQWIPFAARFSVDTPVSPDYQLKVFGYGGGKVAYFDDLKISFEY